jgi:membrane-associated protease RseP (regulator of RpoE activity)
VLMSFGINTQTTTVSSVSKCVIPASSKSDKCPSDAKDSPAKAAGLLPGDKIVAFDGKRVTEWGTLQQQIRDTTGPATITVARDGSRKTLKADLISNKVAKSDGRGGYVEGEYVTAGFLGFTPASGVVPQTFPQSVDRMSDMMVSGVQALVALPSKVPELWDAAFGGAERKQDSPMGVVGAARVGGEVFSLDIPPTQRVATMLFLVAGFNLSLFLFNMLPLLPLDGGHIAGALYEAVRRGVARVRHRPDPGHVDVARLLPVAYVVAGVLLVMGLVLIAGDIVAPVRIG